MTEPAARPIDDGRQRILRCLKCGKVTDCSPEEMLSYTAAGWPQCCDDTMTLFIEAKVPGGKK